MKHKTLAIFLIKLCLISNSVKSQNINIDSTLVGEINPSIKLDSYIGNDILDFDNGMIIILRTEKNDSNFKDENIISLIDLSFKQFEKISIKQKKILPNSGLIDKRSYKIFRFENSNDKIIQFFNHQTPYYVYFDFKNKDFYPIQLPIYMNHKSTNMVQTGSIFLDDKENLVLEFQSVNGKPSKLYQTVDKSGSVIGKETKNKNFKSPICYYGNHEKDDCAFNNSTLKAIARSPHLTDLRGRKLPIDKIENKNTVYISFYHGKYEDRQIDKSYISTYNFICNDIEVKNALISQDLKYLIVNYKYVYKMPKLEITK